MVTVKLIDHIWATRKAGALQGLLVNAEVIPSPSDRLIPSLL